MSENAKPMPATNVVPLNNGNGTTLHSQTAASLFSVTYAVHGQTLIFNLSAEISNTGITGVMGPNGAGKTLLMRLIAGLIEPREGSVQFAPEMAGRVALVFQKPVLLRRTVRENLDHALKIYGVPKDQRKDKLNDLMAIGGLTQFADRPARALSGGEQQRVGIVRALAANPALLLADEPTASLDPTATKAIESLLAGAAKSGVKVVLVTHNQGQAKRLCDDIIFLHKGTAIEHSQKDAFFDEADTAEARAFLAGDLLTT